jgi:hypothetical protein
MTVRTKTGAADPIDVTQDNDAGNLTGSGNMSLTKTFFEGLEWDFEKDWTWDGAADLPVPRYN